MLLAARKRIADLLSALVDGRPLDERRRPRTGGNTTVGNDGWTIGSEG